MCLSLSSVVTSFSSGMTLVTALLCNQPTPVTFLPRDATQSAVMPQYVICPSVSPPSPAVSLSVTFRYCDHTGWNSSKIISRPNSLRPCTPTYGRSDAMGTPPKLGWNRAGVTQEHKKPAISPKLCKIGPRLLLRTNRKSYMRFRLVPKSVTLNNLGTAQSF